MPQRKLVLLPKFFLPATGGLQIASARIGNSLIKKNWQVSVHYLTETTSHQISSVSSSLLETFAYQGNRNNFWEVIPIHLGGGLDGTSVLAVGLEYEDFLDAQIAALRSFKQAGAFTFLRVATSNDIASRITPNRACNLAHLDGIVVLNSEMENEAKACGFQKNFVHRIPVMVDTQRYCPDMNNRERIRKSRGFSQNLLVVLCAGRLDPRKRVELVIKAMAGVDALLWVVGDPTMGPNADETERYVKLARECGLYAVHFEPGVSEADMPALLQGADVFVTASRVEGMSNAVLEASSVGLAIAGFAIPGIEEIATAFAGAGFYLARSDTREEGLNLAIKTALAEHYPVGWRQVRMKSLMNFSVHKVGARWHSLLKGSV